MKTHDAVVVGSGPNGLAAAIRLAREGMRVLVMEASESLGGGARSDELTLPGFVHDVCSAIHPLAVGSPFFRTLPLQQHGLDWIHPKFPLAHPLDNGTAVVLNRSIPQTASALDSDARAYQQLMEPLAAHWRELAPDFLRPMLRLPRHPFLMASFALRGLRSASSVAANWFQGEKAKALFAGLAAHSFLRLDQVPSSAFALVLGAAGHVRGWPMPRGGSGALSQALAKYFESLGGEILLSTKIEKLSAAKIAPITILDVTPRQFLRIAAAEMPASYGNRLNSYRYGPGVFKLDYALSGPIPWRAKECTEAGTIHLGGTFSEVAEAERMVATGSHPDRPFVLLAQPTLFDPLRAPPGKHIGWAYTHVPNGSDVDMTEPVERQIERFAPGFKQLVIARHKTTCADMERHNPNLVGGDINGGAADLFQLIARPIFSSCPYRTPIKGVYLCSSSTPPGGGVHGMCGFHAANAALADLGRTNAEALNR